MVRTARFTDDDFVSATVALVADGGPVAATMQAIARRVGAPTGSIYHRFASRVALLATSWNVAFASFVDTLEPHLNKGHPLEAALAILPWCEADERRARFLLLHEPTALFEDTPPPSPQRERLEELEDALDSAFRACVALCGAGDVNDEEIHRVKFLIFDAPVAMLRPHLTAGKALPPYLEQMIVDLHGGLPISAARRTVAARDVDARSVR